MQSSIAPDPGGHSVLLGARTIILTRQCVDALNKIHQPLMVNEEILSAQIGASMLNTVEYRTFKAPTFAHQRHAIIGKIMHRFGKDYPHDMIRRLAEVEFEIVLEVIKLRDLLNNSRNKYEHN